jgi:hypothetical protein
VACGNLWTSIDKLLFLEEGDGDDEGGRDSKVNIVDIVSGWGQTAMLLS